MKIRSFYFGAIILLTFSARAQTPVEWSPDGVHWYPGAAPSASQPAAAAPSSVFQQQMYNNIYQSFQNGLANGQLGAQQAALLEQQREKEQEFAAQKAAQGLAASANAQAKITDEKQAELNAEEAAMESERQQKLLAEMKNIGADAGLLPKIGDSTTLQLKTGTAFFGIPGNPSGELKLKDLDDPNVVDLRDAKTLVVNPAIIQGNSSQMQPADSAGASYQGTPDKLPPPNPTSQQMAASTKQSDANSSLGLKLSGTAQETSVGGNSSGIASSPASSVNIYQKAAGYTGPLSSPGPVPPSQGALGSKLARFQGVIDAMYAADSSYTTNRYPPGYSILQIFSLARDGTDAVLYGKMDADGKPINLILAFRGTDNLNDWTYGNVPNASGEKSQAYVSAALIARLVQKEFPNTPITLSGHSLGGGEAALASVATGLPAKTFNAAGVRPSDYGYSATVDASKITNYHIVGDVLTTGQNYITAPGTIPIPNKYTGILPTALGNQVSVPALTIQSKNPLTDLKGYAASTGNHGMSAVEPAIINYLSQ